jgi:type 1 glutamine amidotransferase
MEHSRRISVTVVIVSAVAVIATAFPPGGGETSHVPQDPMFRALVFARTAGHRHESIEPGLEAFRALAAKRGFAIVETEDPTVFTDAQLSPFDVIVFLNTTDEHGKGDVLDGEQQEAFVRFIQSGKGYVGIHSASDTEYDWPWYGGLVGAYFVNHPDEQDAEIRVLDRSHPSTRHLPAIWKRFDEWYNFDSDPTGKVRVLAEVDESTYEGGTMGRHPLIWCHEYDGGRSWYTGIGHRPDSFSDSLVVQTIYGGLVWAAGVEDGDCSVPSG